MVLATSSNIDLRTRAMKSTIWYATTRLWTQALSWGVTIILARLLTPNDYGLFAMALTVITFLEMFQEFGLGVAIIQRQKLMRQQLNAIFWIVSAASLAITALAICGARIVANFYNEPRLVWMIHILSLTFLLNSFGMVPYSLLTKEIDFKKRSLAEAYGVVASAAVTLILAYLGYNVWALVFGHLVKTALRNTAMTVFCRWIPGFQTSFADMKEIMKFGLNVVGSLGISTLSEVANTSIIGRFLGGHTLGLFSMADSLGKSNPLHKLSTSILNQVSLPVFSKLQEDDERLREYFLKITKYLAVISLPMQIGMALIANDLVHVLLSEKWLPMVGLLQVFCLGGVFYVLPLPSGPVLQARGRADLGFKISAITATVMTSAFFIGAQISLSTVAALWLVSFSSLRIYLLWVSLRELDLRVRKYIKNIYPSVVGTAIMAIIILTGRIMFTSTTGPLERLILEVGMGAAVYGIVLLLIDRGVSVEIRYIVKEVFSVSRG